MRFIFGVVVGAVLILGSAYLYDTQLARPGNQFVNWTMALGMVGLSR